MPAITIFGFGSQGAAQACNLRDSGWDVTVALRPGSASVPRARSEGFVVATNLATVARESRLVAMLAPDQAHAAIWETIGAQLPPHAAIFFAHGFSIHYRHVVPRADLDILLAAPMCPGPALRRRYREGGVTAMITAVHQNSSGNARAHLDAFLPAVTHSCFDEIPSTFAEETETDLFSEQALLCGGLSHLMLAVFDTIVNAGYNPKIAYYTCLHESRDLAALFAEQGLAGAFSKISAVARHGALTRGPRIINDHVRTTLRTIMQEIRTGTYTRDLAADPTPTAPWRDHLIEQLHDMVTAPLPLPIGANAPAEKIRLRESSAGGRGCSPERAARRGSTP